MALFRYRHSSVRNQRFLYLNRLIADGLSLPNEFPYNASPQRYRRPQNRSYPDRLPACNVRRNPEPYERWCRTQRSRHGGDIYRSRHRRYGQTSCKPCSSRCLAHASQTKHDGEQALIHPSHRAKLGPQ